MRTTLLVIAFTALLLQAVAKSSHPICGDRPNTGCYQSSNVQFTPGASVVSSSGSDWTWTGSTYPTYDNVAPTLTSNPKPFALCVWDGSNSVATQTDYAAPNTSYPLLSSIQFLSGSKVSVTNNGTVVIKLKTLLFDLEYWAADDLLHIISSTVKANAISQLVDSTTGECWGAVVQVITTPANFPSPVPSSLSGSAVSVQAGVYIEMLSSLYNQALMNLPNPPLSAIEFTGAGAALAMNYIMNNPSILLPSAATNLKGLLLAVHYLGVTQGSWYVRDPLNNGASSPGSIPTLTQVDIDYLDGISTLQSIYNANFLNTAIDELNTQVIHPTDHDNLAEIYGFYSGYAYQLEQFAAANGFSADPSTTLLTCDGTRSACAVSGPTTCASPTGNSIFDCTPAFQYLTRNAALLSTRSTLNSSIATNFLNYQNGNLGEPFGRQQFALISAYLTKNATIFHALESVQDSFLEMIEAAGLSAFYWNADQTNRDKLALADALYNFVFGFSQSVAYGWGQNVPTFRWDLGTTPVGGPF